MTSNFSYAYVEREEREGGGRDEEAIRKTFAQTCSLRPHALVASGLIH
jgi:hypothetical protein